jgi:hypothetical protein
MIPVFGAVLVERICRDATADAFGNTVREVVTDLLDGSVWVRLSGWPRAGEARRALACFGLASCDGHNVSLHVTGWDVRLLRRRLAIVLAGVDDLKTEWSATSELAGYCYDRRAVDGEEPDPADVLAEVEAIMRRAVPLPHSAPGVSDIGVLLELIDAAEDAYERLIAEHVDFAEQTIAHRAGTHDFL